eukprot:scpid34297/ scgid11753/ 
MFVQVDKVPTFAVPTHSTRIQHSYAPPVHSTRTQRSYPYGSSSSFKQTCIVYYGLSSKDWCSRMRITQLTSAAIVNACSAKAEMFTRQLAISVCGSEAHTQCANIRVPCVLLALQKRFDGLSSAVQPHTYGGVVKSLSTDSIHVSNPQVH